MFHSKYLVLGYDGEVFGDVHEEIKERDDVQSLMCDAFPESITGFSDLSEAYIWAKDQQIQNERMVYLIIQPLALTTFNKIPSVIPFVG